LIRSMQHADDQKRRSTRTPHSRGSPTAARGV
jgi:hypothetical protein